MTKSASFVPVGVYRPLERLVGVIKRKLDRTAKRSRLNQQRLDRLEYYVHVNGLDWADYSAHFPISGSPSLAQVHARVSSRAAIVTPEEEE